MKKSLNNIRKHYVVAFFFMFLCFVQVSFAQVQGQQEGAKIVFEKTSYDYGTISAGEKGEAVFKFKNEGSAPLVISNVVSSCGCTKPKWTTGPIAAGKSGDIRLTYNTNIIGDIKRSVTVSSNDSSKSRIVLVLTGKVVKQTNKTK